MYAETYEEKEGWIGALGRAMIKPSIMIDEAFDNEYMWSQLAEIVTQSDTQLDILNV